MYSHMQMRKKLHPPVFMCTLTRWAFTGIFQCDNATRHPDQAACCVRMRTRKHVFEQETGRVRSMSELRWNEKLDAFTPCLNCVQTRNWTRLNEGEDVFPPHLKCICSTCGTRSPYT